MVNGYTNKIVKVNLTNREISIEEPSSSFYRRYLGGQGFIAYFLLKEIPKGADPLGEDNRLVFAAGPFTGIPFAGSGRSAVGAKSPLTGGFGESDVGGFFGAELRHAGFDSIVITGKSPQPVYLWIHDGQVEICPADHLWGKTVLDTSDAIKEELKDKHVRLAMIGPGGEKLVRFACVINDLKHAAGRTGLGAVMGSKNLKAVAARGTGKIAVQDQDTVKDIAIWMRDHWEEKVKLLGDYGSAGNVPFLNEASVLPTRNFTAGRFEGADKISGQTMKETILLEGEGCFACPVRCKRVVEVENNRFSVNPAYGGPEYETIGAFGSNCGIDDLEAISKAHELCNAYGLDTISTGGMIAFAMECFENNLLTPEQAGGLDLHFGNADAMIALTQQICERKGLGNILAEGPAAAVAHIGSASSEYVVAVKNQNFPLHEGRARHGQAFGYAVSPTGADHMHNIWDHGVAQDPPNEDVLELGLYEPISPIELNPQKVRAYIYWTHWATIHNHIGNCQYIPWSRDQMVDLLRAITGWQSNIWELMKTAERTTTLARAFNVREGVGRDSDQLPKRLSKPVGNYPGVSPEVFDRNLSIYYEMMGWNPQTGVPSIGKLHELDIAWADDLIAELR